MNIEKGLQRLNRIINGSRELQGKFFRDLMSALTTEIELTHPINKPAGVAHDQAMAFLSVLVRVRGKIHAFHHFQDQWDFEATDNITFFEMLLQDPFLNDRMRDKICGIIEPVLLGFPGMNSERLYGKLYGNEQTEFNGPF